ncbi:hypothetical protein EJ04DRAFT_568800 [Polyplosphaeria fusca]|uniref:Uncharacterized protein n=1 Tax=Polyplosphaeria fusca TaxID=682080 RepID=A0A9P4UXQ1_9PLEO|nr:hypothetical protein EJ04DRAFT_568800 [Polyplosphaeria fusca]
MDLQDELEQPPMATFDVVLDPEGDGGFFRYQNGPGEVQRRHLVDRGNSLVVQGELAEVVHGKLSPDSDDEATLVVTDFHFVPSKASRRFKSAAITLRFEAEASADSAVEVVEISPKESKSPGGLSGTIRLEGRPYGPKNTARWIVSEKDEFGIPRRIRTVTLLRRKARKEGGNARFLAEVEIKTKVDFASTAEAAFDSLLGRTPKDEPVIFDPEHPSTTTRFGTESLDNVDLSELSAHTRPPPPVYSSKTFDKTERQK